MKTVATAIALLLVLAPAAGAKERPKLCGDKQRIQELMLDAREALAELRGFSAAHPDYMTRREMTRKADRLKRLLGKLRSELALPQEPEVPVAPAVLPMASGRFESLIKALAAEAFSKGKVRVVTDAAAHNHFTVDQVKKVMRQFSFADGKVRAAAELYPKLVDPQNFFQAYEELNFEADKKKLRDLIGK